MLLIVGTVRLPSENLALARPAMRAMVEASRAEPGCLEYGYAEDVLVPGLIHVKELWSDQAALDAHFASAHIQTWRAAWPELGIGQRICGSTRCRPRAPPERPEDAWRESA
ncbi:antibiotic biosynthesis monooxygenase [Comamonas testosteroni]|uniref:putative quinol monooxygenase n=1 Tax=Comamonas testosteroni TaxID=285 RepID=UPI0023AABC80|nr:putative quinol monooxygenase [Comamonas testosteroni]WEE76337.1 antibiotic biosynthesis monooxygenase [Comamonas testosteroni]